MNCPRCSYHASSRHSHRGQASLPPTSGLASDICLSLVFKSHPSLWYPAKGFSPASIWLGVGAHCALGGGCSEPPSTVLGPREVGKHYSSQPGPNTLGTAVLPWAPAPEALTSCLVFPFAPRLRSAWAIPSWAWVPGLHMPWAGPVLSSFPILMVGQLNRAAGMRALMCPPETLH